MRVLITGSQGKVGKHIVQKFLKEGDEVIGLDVSRGIHDCPLPTDPTVYIQGDLCDPGVMYSCVSRFQPDAVIHIAAIPDPTHNAPHTVFQNNIMSTFNVLEACVRLGVKRVVYLSSETVPGFHFPQFEYPPNTPEGKVISAGCGRGGSGGLGGVGGQANIPGSLPYYCPVDEEHPIRPMDPYALSKHFGEQLCDAAVRRRLADPNNTISILTIRPSWCQDSTNIVRNLGPLLKNPSLPQAGMWSYIIIDDLATAIVLGAKVDASKIENGHQAVYIAAADNIGNRDLAAAVKKEYGDTVEMKPLSRPDASGLCCKKAEKILGWVPRYTWRDFLTENGELLGDSTSTTRGSNV